MSVGPVHNYVRYEMNSLLRGDAGDQREISEFVGVHFAKISSV